MTLSIKQKMSLGAWAAAMMAAACPVHAGLPTAEQLNQMSPPKRMEAIKALAAQQAATRSTKSGRLDSTPPKVLAFSAGTQVDASKSIEQLTMSLTVTDDLSGVDSIMVSARSPSGQYISTYSNGHAGMLQVKAGLALSLSPFAEPGQWQIVSLGVSDLNNNWTNLDQDALQALGNTKFEVLSASADLVAPKLTSGKILTPEVSASKPAKGTANRASYARVQLNISDSGTDAISGPSYSSLSFCLPDKSVCFYFGSYGQPVYGTKKFSEVANNDSFADVAPGEYLLESVGLSDWAGNYREYTSTEFGGETDFSKLFPLTVLTVKP